MDPVSASSYTDTQRMELRGTIRLASEIMAQYWPMRAFVHHNPLHSLEYSRFDDAVERGRKVLGGKGYLHGDVYRGYVRSGRIRLQDLDGALKPLVRDLHVVLGSRRVSHGEVLRACLTEGLCLPVEEPLDALWEEEPERPLIDALAERLGSVEKRPGLGERVAMAVREDQAALGRHMTLSCWCDRTLGTAIVEQVNWELIKWCEAFLDEGHATWPMPGRERGFYEAWKELAGYEGFTCSIADSGKKLAQLPEHPEDAVLDSLAVLKIPAELRQDYLSLQLAALPGWAGFIKWRGDQADYEWQKACPIGLVKFMAVRLWYVRELVEKACREELGIEGNYHAVSAFMQDHPYAYFLRTQRAAGRLPATYAEEVDRLKHNGRGDWKPLADRYEAEFGLRHEKARRRRAVRRVLPLARTLNLGADAVTAVPADDLATIVKWMDDFPESAHGPVWLRAFEAGYQDRLLEQVARKFSARPPSAPQSAPVRPQAQSVFCIDVRSEPFRRHLESTGAHETYGFAGFFAVFIRYRAWGKEHETEQFPVIMRAKNEVREIPRSFLDQEVFTHTSRAKLMHAGHTLLHDLKENVVTPYVMVESLGWFYGLPIVCKTVLPLLWHRVTARLKKLFVPPIVTCVTVDKLPPTETEAMLAEEQGAVIQKALHEQLGIHAARVAPEVIAALRRQALNGEGAAEPALVETVGRVGLSADRLPAFVESLRKRYRIDRRWASAQKERITRMGFTLDEQVLTLETALRMMGLTRNFARLVLLCAHGSTSENNPFEAALDCGACGGNEGKPNVRVLATMANNLRVRERLEKKGIVIPSDTHVLAGQVDTTTDEVQFFDLQDLPETHAGDVARLREHLREAGRRTSQERCARLPDIARKLTPEQAVCRVHQRSVDWSQVRPEWGLSGNTSFIIGRRALTSGLNLGGRVFLHSYDYREDPTNRLLEVLLTAPQVVAQWINMEHYFSAVDNDVYGGGSKVYHNVVGRVGIMSGPWSDLRLGLAWQTMMSGESPYHEPMRLLTVVEAPRARITELIGRHEVLQHYYHHEWVHLVALEPEQGALYRYLPTGDWSPVSVSRGS
ncbi:MAG: DUF2309 domain-containing protein [Nitrospiraceae bacterium]